MMDVHDVPLSRADVPGVGLGPHAHPNLTQSTFERGLGGINDAETFGEAVYAAHQQDPELCLFV
jgi:hypothetical protein